MKNKGYSPICADFLKIKPERKYNVILMNPPFTEQYAHIEHAYKFLKEGGTLISVVMSGILEKKDRKSQEFKKWFQEKDGYYYKLPPGSFKETGTDINTALLIFEKE